MRSNGRSVTSSNREHQAGAGISKKIGPLLDVMEIDVVEEELAAHWMVAELVMHQRLRK
jgi:hypothetical protein